MTLGVARSRRPRPIAIAFGMLLVASACAGSDRSSDAPNHSEPAANSAPDEARDRTATVAVAVDDLIPLDVEIRSEARETYTFPAMGGLRFSADESHGVYSIGDRVMVDPIGSGIGSFRIGAAYLGLATQATDGAPIHTVDEFLTQLASVDGLVAEPNGRSVELFDRRLVGYTVDREDGAVSTSGLSEDSAFSLFASTRHGAPALHSWAPQLDELFVADTAAGVLYAGYSAGGSRSEPVARPAFETLVATATLTGPGLDAALPAGSISTATGEPPDPAPVVANGPEPLWAASGEVFPGVYQLPNFGQPLSAELTGWWVTLNRPGGVVLTWRDTAGPGRSELALLSGVSPTLTRQAGGPRIGAGALDLTDIESFIGAPPPGLTISAVEDTTVGGFAAKQFDVQVSDGATCAQSEPCEFAFETPLGRTFNASIRAESKHRLWWIPNHPTGTAVILASDPYDTFLERATEVVESIAALR